MTPQSLSCTRVLILSVGGGGGGGGGEEKEGGGERGQEDNRF